MGGGFVTIRAEISGQSETYQAIFWPFMIGIVTIGGSARSGDE